MTHVTFPLVPAMWTAGKPSMGFPRASCNRLMLLRPILAGFHILTWKVQTGKALTLSDIGDYLSDCGAHSESDHEKNVRNTRLNLIMEQNPEIERIRHKTHTHAAHKLNPTKQKQKGKTRWVWQLPANSDSNHQRVQQWTESGTKMEIFGKKWTRRNDVQHK